MAKTDGWVKIHRKILATELTASQFKFFIGAILLAKSPKSQASGLVDLSVRQLSDELHMARSEVWRREKELAAMQMITLLDKGFRINNYDYYQTGKGVPPAGQSEPTKTTPTVPSAGQQTLLDVPPTGRSVPPTGRSVPPTGRSVPSRTSESAHKTIKKVKTIKKIPSKKKRYIFDNIHLTDEEYQKLIERFGEAGTKDRLEALSLYKKSKGKKYKDDYATVLAWEHREKRMKGGKDGARKRGPQQLKERHTYSRPEDL